MAQPIKTLTEKEKAVAQKFSEKKQTVLDRFPLLFTLLGTFGLVATLYGFEGLIDRVDVLAEHPFILLCVGVGTLIGTGSLYKKLG
jgi:hypothetical protein